MGTHNNPSRYDCDYAALPDEPTFRLLARDPSFARLVRAWARRRQDDVSCGERPESDMAKVEEAFTCADAGEEWRRCNLGAWRVVRP